MAKTTQKIGNVVGSKDVNVTQNAKGEAQQEVGIIAKSERIQISQDFLESQSDELLNLGTWLLTLNDKSRADIVPKVRNLLIEETGDISLEATVLEHVANVDLPKEVRQSPVGEAIRDAASAVSLVSGSIAIAAVTNPLLLMITIPTALVVTGVLQKERLKGLYDRILHLARKVREHE